MEIKENKWHWWLVKKFTDTRKSAIEEGIIDSCTYRGRVIKGLVGLVFVSVLLTVLGLLFLFSASGYGLYVAKNGFDFTFFLFMLALSWALVCALLIDYAEEWEYKTWMPDWFYIELFSGYKEDKDPSFLQQCYRQMRDKFCTKVSFKK